MKRSEIIKAINSGRICRVEFVKKDGSLGTVQGRTGVKKHTKGGERTTDPDQYIIVYDFKKGYRNVAIDRITTFNGQSID